ncbi:MAG: prolipoprotein diacylglyceryl transferase [Candidatus Hydrogenedens sp.]|jgi:phosphatidylglycerol:prolipoprotein diacylglycerol transferase|nr:prolipoprotein diacylglyceryl transferase [Candidatus Hydrogenedens sp.]
MEPTGDYWIHNLDPKLIHLWGNMGISYYGLSYVLAFVLGVVMHRLMIRRKRSPFGREEEELLLYSLVLGVLGGARVGYCVLYALPELLARPWFLFEVWHGGMSFHGGLIGVILACMWVKRRTGVTFLQIGDLIAPMAPVGLFLGRIANFINGELWGKVSYVSWAVIFPRSEPGLAPELILPRHPSQLYEALLEGLVLFIILQWRFWKTSAWRFPGKLSGEFLFFYAIFRIFCEYFREPDASLFFGISRGTFYSVFILLFGLVLWIRAARAEERAYPVRQEARPKTVPKKKNKKK